MIFKIFISILFLINSVIGYEIPKATIVAYADKGFKASIPDEPGITLFAFHGRLNGNLSSRDPGQFEGEVRKAKNGKWSYENKDLVLQVGDVIAYWLFVQHEQYGYRLEDQKVTVTKLVSQNSATSSTHTTNPVPPYTPTRGPTTASIHPTKPVPPYTPTRPTTTTTTQPSVTCTLSTTIVQGKNVCRGELIFEDSFSVFDDSKWRREIKIPLDSEDAEFVSYQDHPDNLYIQDNILWILPKLQTDYEGYDEDKMRLGELNLNPSCTGTEKPSYECYRRAQRTAIIPPIVSAKISTKNKFSFMHGKIEIRAKFPKGDWLFPELYLEPLEHYYGLNGFISGQMRVGFIRGNELLVSKENTQIDGYRLSGGVVLSPNSKHRDIWMKSVLFDTHLGNDFHVYKLTWTPTSISVSIDDSIYSNNRPSFKVQALDQNITHANAWSDTNSLSPFDREFYISLGVGAGGMGDFPDLSRTGTGRLIKPWNNTSPKAEYNFFYDKSSWYPTWLGNDAGMQVDYVKVWAL